MIKNSRAVSPVVATSLLLVVAVSSVVFFQGWFTDFSSQVLVDVESDSSSNLQSFKVEGIIGDELYLNSNLVDSKLNSLRVLDSSGVEVCNFESDIEVLNVTDGLFGEWKFDDNNSTIKDYSGNNFDGTLYGFSRVLFDFDNSNSIDKTIWNNSGVVSGASWTNSDCVSGGCYNFDGIDDDIRILYNESIDIYNDFSISLWVKKNSCSGDFIFYNGVYGVDSSVNLICDERFNYSNTFNFGYDDNEGHKDVLDIYRNLTYDNSWHHIVVSVKDNDSISMYIDSKFVGKNSLVGSLRNNTRDFIIGDYEFSNGFNFNGSIDEFSFYSKALDLNDVKKLYKIKKAEFMEFGENGLEFNHDKDYLNLNFNSNYDTVISGLIDFELKYDYDFIVERGLYHCFISTYQGTPGGWQVCIGDETHPLYAYSNGVVIEEMNYSNLIKPNSNNQLYFSFINGSKSKLYLNGFEIGDNILNTTILRGPNNLPIIVGKRADSFAGGANFEGFISNIKLFDRELNSSEIESFYLNSISKNSGVSKIDLTRCNLDKKQKYSIVGITDNGVFESEVVSR